MTKYRHFPLPVLLCASLLSTTINFPAFASSVIKFQPPGDVAPRNALGGGVRGNISFQPPGDVAPRNALGGGVRGDLIFRVPGESAPVNTIGGGVRSSQNQRVIALLPDTAHGRTIASHPTILVYVPPTSSRQAFFSLQDETGQSHYQTQVEISGQGGIIRITIPPEIAALEIGKDYAWFFAPIEPGQALRPDNYSVSGWVRRVAEPLSNSLLTPLERASLYANSGIWYDSLSVLAAAKLAQPDDPKLTLAWEELLTQVGLAKIAQQPID